MTTDAALFWSYTHADDDAEGGRIVRLAHLLVAQYGLLTGEDIQLFVDRSALEWGDAWRDRIDSALARTTYFVPIVTPRYLRSDECGRELLRFSREARSLGVNELLLPVLYAELGDVDPTDEAMTLIGTHQWSDWKTLRLTDEASAEHRRAVSDMAERLVRAGRQAETMAVGVPAVQRSEPVEEAVDEGEDEPGLLEIVTEGIAALPTVQVAFDSLIPALDEMGTAINSLGPLTSKIAANPIATAHRMAQVLDAPVKRFETQVGEASRSFATVDAAMTGMLRFLASIPPLLEAEQTLRDLIRLEEQISESTSNAEETITMVSGFAGLSLDPPGVIGWG
jgi:hypothetical protein